jgi:hypothetical protein
MQSTIYDTVLLLWKRLLLPLAGSAKPIAASPGYYTTGGASTTVRDSQVRCEAGSYCVAGVKYACPAGTYGRTTGLRCVSLSSLKSTPVHSFSLKFNGEISNVIPCDQHSY